MKDAKEIYSIFVNLCKIESWKPEKNYCSIYLI